MTFRTVRRIASEESPRQFSDRTVREYLTAQAGTANHRCRSGFPRRDPRPRFQRQPRQLRRRLGHPAGANTAIRGAHGVWRERVTIWRLVAALGLIGCC